MTAYFRQVFFPEKEELVVLYDRIFRVGIFPQAKEKVVIPLTRRLWPCTNSRESGQTPNYGMERVMLSLLPSLPFGVWTTPHALLLLLLLPPLLLLTAAGFLHNTSTHVLSASIGR